MLTHIQLLDHQAHLNFVPPPNALRQVSPDSALPMLSMMYRAQGGAEERQQHLLVFTEKASLQATESDARRPHAWARTDTSADYDDYDWDNIGDKCKAKDIACSAIIVGSPEAAQTVSSPGRDGSQSVERLRKMCQEVSDAFASQTDHVRRAHQSPRVTHGFRCRPTRSPFSLA